MTSCCSCNLAPVPSSCRQVITSADIAELLYLQGLDANLCTKFALVVPGLSLIDCEGNPIVIGEAVVTCAEFADQLCTAIAALTSGGEAIPGVTEVVGNDCLTYTLPTICSQLAALIAGDPVILGVTPLVGADCLTHVVPETPFTFTDTSTIDGTVSGAFGHDLTAEVKVSAFPGNEIVILVDGLYAPEPDVVDINVVGLDTPCFDITVTEAPANTFTISGAPVVSPNAGNSLSCAGNGLYVPTADVEDIIIVAADTACLNIDVTEAPANTFTITGNPIISPNAGNILECVGNGLFVPEGSTVIIQAVDNGCIELDAVESPAGTWTITPTLVISPNAGNEASCLDNGLYVPPGATPTLDCAAILAAFDAPETTIQPGDGILTDTCDVLLFPTFAAVDTLSVDTTVTNTGTNWNISSDLILADTYPGFGAGCNSLVIDANGLSAPPNSTGNAEANPQASIYNAAIIQGATFTSAANAVAVTNPSDCRFAVLTVYIDFPEVNIGGAGTTPNSTRIVTEWDANLPGFIVTGGFVTFTNEDIVQESVLGWDTPFSTTAQVFIVPPSFVGSVSGRVVITQLLGDLDSLQVFSARVQYTLFTI